MAIIGKGNRPSANAFWPIGQDAKCHERCFGEMLLEFAWGFSCVASRDVFLVIYGAPWCVEADALRFLTLVYAILADYL